MSPENSNCSQVATNEGAAGESQEESAETTVFRIKNVQEINSTVETSNEKRKRKLPAWLLSPRLNKQMRSENLGEGGSNSLDDNIEADKNPEGRSNSLDDNVEAGENVVDSEEPQNVEQGAQNIAQEQNEAVEATATENEEKKPDIKIKVETDVSSADDPCSSSADAAVVKQEVIKQEATSSIRDSCQFGIRCYRRNLDHKAEMAHPGDADYRRPSFPAPPKGTPECRYGDRCYRRNPIHFQHYSHPESTDFKKNWEKRQLRKRKQKKDPAFVYFNDDDESEAEDEDEENDFSTDGSEDEYVPTDDE